MCVCLCVWQETDKGVAECESHRRQWASSSESSHSRSRQKWWLEEGQGEGGLSRKGTGGLFSEIEASVRLMEIKKASMRMAEEEGKWQKTEGEEVRTRGEENNEMLLVQSRRTNSVGCFTFKEQVEGKRKKRFRKCEKKKDGESERVWEERSGGLDGEQRTRDATNNRVYKNNFKIPFTKNDHYYYHHH